MYLEGDATIELDVPDGGVVAARPTLPVFFGSRGGKWSVIGPTR